jgi:hypothetical protein
MDPFGSILRNGQAPEKSMSRHIEVRAALDNTRKRPRKSHIAMLNLQDHVPPEGINRGLSPVLKPGFFSAAEDVAADKAFGVYGGEETYRLKPGIEAIGLKSLQQALLAREQGE